LVQYQSSREVGAEKPLVLPKEEGTLEMGVAEERVAFLWF